jgi:hypothetical protein
VRAGWSYLVQEALLGRVGLALAVFGPTLLLRKGDPLAGGRAQRSLLASRSFSLRR